MLQGQEVRTVLDAKGYIELDDSMMIVYGIIPTGRVKIKGRLEIEHSGRYMLVDSVDFGNNKKVIHGYTDTHAYFTLPLVCCFLLRIFRLPVVARLYFLPADCLKSSGHMLPLFSYTKPLLLFNR